MDQFLTLTNTITGAGAFLLQIGIIVLILAMVFRCKKVLSLISKHHLVIVFLVSFLAMMGSLWYSDVLLFEPCLFCWYQRIFMYPIVFIFGTALIKKYTNEYKLYGLVLSFIGMLLAAYHYIIKTVTVPETFIPCSDYTISCTTTYVNFFGYIDIPMMSFTIFTTIFLVLLISKRHQ